MKKLKDVCKSHEPSFEIPYGVQIEILTKLPVKSLMRFKSVSKLWSSFICSQYFIDRYLKVSSPSLRMYMWLSFEGSPRKKLLLSASSSSSSSSSSLDSDLPSFIVDQNLIISEGYYVSHVYRGLMCFVNVRSAEIYNTSTRQLVVLPDIEALILRADEKLTTRMIVYYIGYDRVHNQYKVVCSFSRLIPLVTEIWVLLLGGDGSSSQWRKISNKIDLPHRPCQRKGSSCLSINGRMYYFALVKQYLLDPILMLVSIDLHCEEISFLQRPEHSAELIEFNGKADLLEHL